VKAMFPIRIATRSWIQWSLRSFLIAMVVLAAVFARWGAKIRREARIDNAVRLIAASPTLFSDDYDTIALIRAVNALYSLGKDDAIEAIRRFAAQYSAVTYKSPILFINRLLWDFADPEDRFDHDAHQALWLNEYCSNCIAVEDDIPFRFHPIHVWGSRPEFGLLPVIDWAEKHGRLRSNPLRPLGNPLDAAEALLDHLVFADPLTNKKFLREQAYRAVSPLLSDEDFGGRQLTLENDDDWSLLKKHIGKLGVRWSDTCQAYVREATNR